MENETKYINIKIIESFTNDIKMKRKYILLNNIIKDTNHVLNLIIKNKITNEDIITLDIKNNFYAIYIHGHLYLIKKKYMNVILEQYGYKIELINNNVVFNKECNKQLKKELI